MQTFLPFPDFAESAAALDDRRLGKQRVEVLQILRALHLEDYGWQRHPAVEMWRGHARALVSYGAAVVAAWTATGRPDSTLPQIAEFAVPAAPVAQRRLRDRDLPPWLGQRALHASHRAALVRKDPGHYGALFPTADPEMPYLWPAPPAQPEAPRPFSAWVVRMPSQSRLDHGILDLPADLRAAKRTPKRRRQIAMFTDEMAAGDRIVLVTDIGLHLGWLGEPMDDERTSRAVQVGGQLGRNDLKRPWQLQDPRTVFALRGEAVLT